MLELFSQSLSNGLFNNLSIFYGLTFDISAEVDKLWLCLFLLVNDAFK